MKEIRPVMKLIIRGKKREFLSAIGKSLNLLLPTEANTSSSSEKLTALWLSPDEWLVYSNEISNPDNNDYETENLLNKNISKVSLGAVTDFTDQFVNYYITNLNTIFTNKRDIIVADTLLELFRIRDNIENFNKKALYILIRERTGLKTQNITQVVNIMKKHYAAMYLNYTHRGFIGTHKS